MYKFIETKIIYDNIKARKYQCSINSGNLTDEIASSFYNENYWLKQSFKKDLEVLCGITEHPKRDYLFELIYSEFINFGYKVIAEKYFKDVYLLRD